MSNAVYRSQSSENRPSIEGSEAQRNIGLASGSMIAALVAFIFGTCLFVSLDAMRKRYSVEAPIMVSSLAPYSIAPRGGEAF